MRRLLDVFRRGRSDRLSLSHRASPVGDSRASRLLYHRPLRLEWLEDRSLLSLAPTGVDLLPGSDSGIFDDDNLTNLDNSAVEKSLQFEVSGTAAGATVTLYADGTAIGSATATDTLTTITTDGAHDLADGTHSITARQTEPEDSESGDSPGLGVRVDTLASIPGHEIAKLLASDGAGGDCFGYSVSISGTMAIIGACSDDDCGSSSGSAYLFEDTGSGWTQVGKLTASDGAQYDYFGYSVAISGMTAIVGAHGDDDRGTDSGSAYVFADTGSGWTQVAKLTASDGRVGDSFGCGVSISGATAIVGAYHDDDRGNESGSAYLFEDTGSGWVQVARLNASDGAAGDSFGYSVSLSGTTAIVGARHDDDHGSFSGSAYIFEDTGSAWTQVAKLNASDGAAGDWFGYSVSIDGTTAIVGAHYDDDLGSDSGSAYVFQDTGSAWTQVAKLNASDGAAGDFFGSSVSVSGGTAVVGAHWDDDRGGECGSAYVFADSGSTWLQVAKLVAADTTAGDVFGFAVSVSAGKTIIGACGDDDLGSASGSVSILAAVPTFDLQVASDTGLSATDNITGDPTPTFDVGVAPYFRVYRDGNRVSGDWENGATYTDGPLTQGAYEYVVASVDAAGNESLPSLPLSVTIALAPPLAPLAPDLDRLSDTGVSDSDNVTSNGTLTLHVGAADFFRVYCDGVQVSGDYESGGVFTTAAQPDGTYEYTVLAIDSVGQESPMSAPLSVTIDTEAPDAPALAPDLQAGSDTGVDDGDDLTCAATLTFDVGVVPYYRFYRDGIRVSGDYEASPSVSDASAPADGRHDYTVRAVDAAGNESAPSQTLSVTVDTLAPALLPEQIAKLLADDGAAGDLFGSVSISGNMAIVGAFGDDHHGNYSGSAYIFEATASGWTQVAKLVPADVASGDCFGRSVSISGNTAIVGAEADDDRGVNSGSVYVYEDTGSGWSQVAKLTAADGDSGDFFGCSVSISGTKAVIGADSDEEHGTYAGSAYVFENTGSGWAQVAKLSASDATKDDLFGHDVAISGTTAIVGAYRDDELGTYSGSAYIFEDTGSGWTQVAKLTAADGRQNEQFGREVAISGTTAIVAAHHDDDLGIYSGSAYIFENTGSGWTQIAKLTASDGTSSDYFGSSVSISDTVAVIGAAGDEGPGATGGSAYLFEKGNGRWTQIGKLTAADGATGDCFGGVSMSGETILVGAACDDDCGDRSGSAYLFHVGSVLADDTGVNSRDRITSDAAPEVRFVFAEPVFGEDSDLVVLDPNGDPVTPDSIAGWGSDTLTLTFSTPLTVDGEYTVTLRGASTITDAAGNPLGDGVDQTATFTLDTAGPAVAGVCVRGTAWTDGFLDYLDSQGLGQPGVARLGYRVPTGDGQRDSLPWGNIDTITVVFGEDVAVAREDLTLSGVSVPEYAVAGFSYDPTTHAAIWTLALRIDVDTVSIALAGTVEDVAGNAMDGGEFDFAMSVLPGDANHSGTVDDADAAIMAAHWSASGVTFYGDFNGDTLVDARDASILGAHWRAMLPSPSEGELPDASVPIEPIPPGGAPLIGPVLLGTSSGPRRRIEPLPASHAAAEARSEAALPEQVAARDAVFAEASDSSPNGEMELLRHRLAWSYELAQRHGQKRSPGHHGTDARRVDALLAAGVM